MENTLAFGVRNLKIETTNEWFSLQWSEGFGSGNSIVLCVWIEREKTETEREMNKILNLYKPIAIPQHQDWQLLQEKERKIYLVELDASRGMLSKKAEMSLDILGCR